MSELCGASGAVFGAVKAWLRAEGLVVFAASLLLYRNTGHSWIFLIVLFLVPDLSMLGFLVNPRIGALCYNLVHSYVGPIALGAACVILSRADVLPYVYIWTAHIGIDRFFGYGLKYPDAFGHTHLGVMGRRPTT